MARPQDPSPVTTGNGESQPNLPPVDDRSLGSLIKELGDEGSRLIREEIQLAKTELRENIEVYERNTVKMVLGVVMLLGAFFVMLVAVNRGLTVVLGEFMAAEVAVWMAPLILAGIVGGTGWSMTRSAQSQMKREGITPTQTMRTLREEKNWVQQQAREVRNG